MATFEINDLVMEAQFGIGTVTGFSKFEDGTDVVIVNFERVGKKKLVLAFGKLLKITQQYLDQKQANHDNWPESTLEYETADQPHYMGSHWVAFCDDNAILKALPVHLQNAIVLEGYGSFFKSPLCERSTFQPFFQLHSPNHDMGLSVVVEPSPEQNLLRTVYPFYGHGKQNGLIIERVIVWDGGCEAQIEAIWGGAEICFFDTRYIHNREWYVAQEMYEFLLTGIAYSAQPAESHVFTINHKPELLSKLIEIGAIDKPEDLSNVVDMSQAAILLPIPEWDKDDYQFHGKIKELKIFDDFLGQSGWIATVTVIKNLDDDTDQDLKIVITRKIWKADTEPTVGEFIQGRLWLQGHLLNVTNKHHF